MSAQAAAGGRLAPDGRTVAALTETMAVHEVAPGLFDVVKPDATTHRVALPEGACECADQHYRGGECKHVRRVRIEAGRDPIPAWVSERDRLAPGLRPVFDRQRDD